MNNRLVWFRNDLRLHDNETLNAATANAPGLVAYIYIHHEPEQDLARSPAPMGRYRKQFLAESLLNLRQHLRDRGADLICLVGDPIEILPKLCVRHRIGAVYYSRMTAFNERRDERLLDQKLKEAGVVVQRFLTQTLLHDADVSFDMYRPMSFSKRRSLLEKCWFVRRPLSKPETLPKSVMPDEPQWDFQSFIKMQSDSKGLRMCGGESPALKRTQDYIWMRNCISTYQETRNGLLAIDDSSKFSPALSLGCLSPRFIYQEILRYEEKHLRNRSTACFISELLWRDHFYFLARARGVLIFTKVVSLKTDGFSRWRDGQTGNAFIDAAMIELSTTGWLSNRMRQNAASFLIRDLGVDWRLGAGWFETNLIDYDPCSNWGNWAYIAGADFSGKPHKFDVDQQQRNYDPDGSYTEFWITQQNLNPTS